MPDVFTNLHDIVVANNAGLDIGLLNSVDEITKAHPETAVGAFRTINGVQYQTLVRTGVVGSAKTFKKVDGGTTAMKTIMENRTVGTYDLEALFTVPKSTADRSEDGAAVFIASEMDYIMEQKLQGVGRQFFYGNDKDGYGTNAIGDVDGFPGLITAYDPDLFEVDAEATDASEGEGSSVWFVRFGLKDVSWVYGKQGQWYLSPLATQLLDAPDGSGKTLCYYQALSAYPGLQVGSPRCVGRIKNLGIDTDTGHTLTDKLINDMLAKMKIPFLPTDIFMTQRSVAQLRSSRVATTQTGIPPEWPNKIGIMGLDGKIIPIHVTASLSDTEELVS